MSRPTAALTDDEVSMEMRKMQQFIHVESQEKSRELLVKAEEDHHIEKAKLTRSECLSVDAGYTQKYKAHGVKQRVRRSLDVGRGRMAVLRVREQCLTDVREQAMRKVLTRVAAYSETEMMALLSGLLEQACQMVGDDGKMEIHCRADDVDILRGIARGIPLHAHLPKDAYGLVLTQLNGRIVCDNTLATRMALVMEGLLPQVRMTLFGPAGGRRFFD